MRFNKLLALLLAVLMIFTQLPVLAAEEEAATFTVSSISPMDGERNVPIVNTKVDITFSEPVNSATLNMANISVTSGAFRSVVATSATTATIYLDRDVLRLGEKYTVTLKSGIKAVSGASLVEKKITFTMTRTAPSYRQITNQGLDDPNFLSGFIGDTRNNLSVVNEGGNNVLKFVLPGWNEGALKTNPAVVPGSTYTGRLRFKLATKSQAWIAALIYQPGNQNFYRTGTVRQEYEPNQWYTLEATWSIPDDADVSKFQFLFAVKDPNIVAYVDDIHFFEVGNDIDPPVITAGGVGGAYTVIAEDNTPINKFKALGILANSAEPDSTISRIDLAKILLNLKGLTSYPVVTSTKFTDVEESQMPVVQSVIDMGLMNGASATTFEPNEKVTMDQVIKTLVNLMGWGNIAEKSGGYPGGYNKVAAELGLLNGVSTSAGERFTTNDLAMVLNNALDAEVLEVNRYNGTIDSYFSVRGGTFLETFFQLGYGKGVIEANENTYLYKQGNLAKDKVLINDTIYTCDADVQNYLGYEVFYYYEEVENSDTPRIKYISGTNTYNEVVEFSTLGSDYLGYTDGVYYHSTEENTKPSKYEIERNRNIIYNGKYLGTYSNDESTFVPAYGKVKIVDSGNGFETVVITDVRTVFVGEVDLANMVIYDDKGGDPIYLEDTEDLVILDNEDSPWAFKDIKKYSVISVIQSKDREMTTIYFSTKTVTGPVVSISTDESESELVIGDDFYGQTVRDTYKVVDSYFDVNTLSLSTKGTFYLDWLGKVAAFSVGTAASGVGYLVDAMLDSSTLDGNVEFKIFDTNGRMLYIKGDSKITVDVERVKDPARVIELLKKGTSDVVPQLVMFATNRDGLLTQIDTAYNKLPNTDSYLEVVPSSKDNEGGFRITYSSIMKTDSADKFKREVSNNEKYYYDTYQEYIDAGWTLKEFNSENGVSYQASARSFENKALMQQKGEPTIFVVPWADVKDAEDEAFAINRSAWDFGEGSKYCIEAYNIADTSLISDYIVVHSDSYRTSYYEDHYSIKNIVSDIKQVYKDDQSVTAITLVDGKTAYTTDISYISNVTVGDYCRIFVRPDNYIYKNTEVIYDIETGNMTGAEGFGSFNKGYSVNDVYEKLDTTVRVVAVDSLPGGNPYKDYQLMNLSGTSIYMFNRLKKEVEPAALSDILSYKQAGDDKSTIFVVSSKAKPSLVYIVTK